MVSEDDSEAIGGASPEGGTSRHTSREAARSFFPWPPLDVVGAGIVSAAGVGEQAFFASLTRPDCLLRPLDGFKSDAPRSDSRVLVCGGRLPDAALGAVLEDLGDRVDWRLPEDRALVLLAAAVRDAFEELPDDSAGISLLLGTALGDVESHEEAARARRSGASDRAESFESIAERLIDALEPLRKRVESVRVFSATCVSGLCALEAAAADLSRSRSRRALVAAFDTLSASMQAGFTSLRALSPSGRLRPFDREHDGILLGEGAAAVVLEASERSRVTILGTALESDAFHMTSPDPSGAGMARAIERALESAGRRAEDIGCITVTATGSAIYDRMISRSVERALGERIAGSIPVTTWEGQVGHLLAATGIAALVHARGVLSTGRIEVVTGVDHLDAECRLDYVLDGPRTLEKPLVLTLIVGFGGQNGAVLIGERKASRAAAAGTSPIAIEVQRSRCETSARAIIGRGAWAGWSRDADGLRAFADDRPSTAVAALRASPGDFPGRWNPRRGLPEYADPLVSVVARALERAAWWQRGSGELVDGGLVVAVEGGSGLARSALAVDLFAGASTVRPGLFLEALPSTCASVIGLLFGLTEHQTTLIQGPGSGRAALAHAADLIDSGRLRRVVIATLTRVEEELALSEGLDDNPRSPSARLAAALAIESVPEAHWSTSRLRDGEWLGAQVSDRDFFTAGFWPRDRASSAAVPVACVATALERAIGERR